MRNLSYLKLFVNLSRSQANVGNPKKTLKVCVN